MNTSRLSLNDIIRTTVGNLSRVVNISSDFADYVRRLYLFGNVSLTDTDVVTVIHPNNIRDSLSFIGSQSPRTVQNYLIMRFIMNEKTIMTKRFRSMVHEMFHNIRNVFIHMVNQSTWMDSKSKIMTIKKVGLSIK
ncbi:unnamed protein product [Rotaria sp. Silwood2]|nr:unnamed protein product [Rotaria sp. Silwood2]